MIRLLKERIININKFTKFKKEGVRPEILENKFSR